MSSNDDLSSDEERSVEDEDSYEESSEEDAALSAEDRLFDAVQRNDADATEAVQQAIRDGANVNAVRDNWAPLTLACGHGCDQIVGILLDAGDLALSIACINGHLSIVQLLTNHDNGLLEMTDKYGTTPLLCAVWQQHPDIVQFLLDEGANAHHVDHNGDTALMLACQEDSLDNARLLLVAGVDVEARDQRQRTALHFAARCGSSEILLELILQHNANMFAVDRDGCTPFDEACKWLWRSDTAANTILDLYGNKLIRDHDSLALHVLMRAAEYSFSEDHGFHPPLNPLRIILPLGKLTLTHLRTLLHTLDPELIRHRDDTGMLPIRIACQTNAPMEVLALILELDPAVLHLADSTGALPIHLLCGTTAATEYASVQYLWSKVVLVLWPLASDKDFCHCMFCPKILHCKLSNV